MFGKKVESTYGKELLKFTAKFLKKHLKSRPHTMQELGEEAFRQLPSPNDLRETVYLLIRVWQGKGGVDVEPGGVTWRRDVKVDITKLAGWPSSLRRHILGNWGVPGCQERIEALLKDV